MARNVRGVEKTSPGFSIVSAGTRTPASTLPAAVVFTGIDNERRSGRTGAIDSPTPRLQNATTGIPPPTYPRSSFVGTGAPKGFSWENRAGIGKSSSLPHFKLAPSNVHSGSTRDLRSDGR